MLLGIGLIFYIFYKCCQLLTSTGTTHHIQTMSSTELQPLSEKEDDPPPPNNEKHVLSPRETRNLSIMKAAGMEAAKESLIRKIFPAGRKATGVRRYCMALTLLVIIDVVLWCTFYGIYHANVVPVLGLETTGAYVKSSCVTMSQRVDKQNSLFYDVWRGELTVEYNDTSSGTTRQATIYDTVTGLHGREFVSVDFLDTFPVGKRFQCHVKKSNKYFAAVKPEAVYVNAVVSLVVLAMFGVLFFVAMWRSFASYIRFRRDFIWDEQREAWIVKSPSVN